MRPLLIAWLVRMLTVRSRRSRGAYPHTVAGRSVTATNPGSRSCSRSSSHIAVNIEIKNGHFIVRREQLGDQAGADITRAACHHHPFKTFRHSIFPSVR